MPFFNQHRVVWAFLLAGSLVACSGAGDFVGGTKSSKNDSNGDDKEDDEAGEPQEVSGAFLTCTYIQDPAFGCAVFASVKKPLSKTDYSFSMVLLNDAGDEVDMKSSTAPEASEFHLIGNLPPAYQDSGKLKVTVKPIKGEAYAKEFSLPTKDIQEQPLGTTVNLDDPVAFTSGSTGVDPTKVTLKSFTVIKTWTPAKGTSVMGSLAVQTKTAVPSNFCIDGAINSQLSSDAQVLSGGISTLFRTKDNPNGLGDVNFNILPLPSGPTNIGTDTNICFKRFSASLGGGELALAHVGSGCIFVWGVLPQGEFLMIGPEMQNGGKIGVDPLREFAQVMNDRPACK